MSNQNTLKEPFQKKLNHKIIPEIKMPIYKIPCECDKFYIGETSKSQAPYIRTIELFLNMLANMDTKYLYMYLLVTDNGVIKEFPITYNKFFPPT